MSGTRVFCSVVLREKIQEDNAYKVPSLHQNPSDHYPPQPELHVDNDGPTFEVRSPIIESRNPEETRTKGRNRTHRYQAQAKQNAEDAAETNYELLRRRVRQQLRKIQKPQQKQVELYFLNVKNRFYV